MKNQYNNNRFFEKKNVNGYNNNGYNNNGSKNITCENNNGYKNGDNGYKNNNTNYNRNNDKSGEQKVVNNNNENLVAIISYVFDTIDLSKYKYKIMETEEDLQLLSYEKYYISANFNGKNCLLVFKKINNKFMSFLIERKKLKYNKDHINFDEVRYYNVSNRSDTTIYDGTIIDGIYIDDRRTHEKIFIMTDIYQFRGSSMTNETLKNKFYNINAYLNSKKTDKFLNNITFIINNLYTLTDILKLKDDITKSKGLETRGFAFYPDHSGTKLYFLNINENKKIENIISEKTENEVTETEEEFVKPKKIKYINITNNIVFAVLEMRKTESPDIYNIFCSDIDKENQDRIKIVKIGILSIPDIKTSIMCKNIILEKKNNRALMKCKFDDKKFKWVPIEEELEKRIPDLLSHVNKNFKIIEVDL